VRPVLVIVVPVVLATTAAVLVLVRLLDVASSQGRLEMIRTALAVGAGTGAVMTLVLAWRRQWSTEHDAAERRLTELYVKAVEQLGSDKAAVRHGALYALERVAQDNPDHRQTVVDVICAYLRAPFTPPPDKPGARKLDGLRAPLRPHRPTWQRSAPATALSPTSDEQDKRQEREVRLTAQRILERHLQPGHRSRLRRQARTFWSDINLDLTDATLINFSLRECDVGGAWFGGVRFEGVAWFVGARIVGVAQFDGARFDGGARFGGAHFDGARFDGAQFVGAAGFGGARFEWDAWFDGARFDDAAWFDGARFDDIASFDGARFDDIASFDGARFRGDAEFEGARFSGDTRFEEARFSGDARFEGATLPSIRRVRYSTPSPWTDFTNARFKREVPPEVEQFVTPLPVELQPLTPTR
jgi:uncharacterized protein YjbI with pentapeptide repeats